MSENLESIALYRAQIDRQIKELGNIDDEDVPSRLKALYLALRMQANTMSDGVSQTSYLPMFSGEGRVFPDPHMFEQDIWDEIRLAALEVKSLRSAAQLADLSWLYQGDYRCGLLAIEKYTQLYTSLGPEVDSKHLKTDFLIAIYRALELSKQLNSTAKHVAIVSDILSAMEKATTGSEFALTGWLVSLFRMAHSRIHHFSLEERDSIFHYSKRMYENGKRDEYLTRDALEVARDFARSLNLVPEEVGIQAQIVRHLLDESFQENGALIMAERYREAVSEIWLLPRDHEMKHLIAGLELRRQQLLSDESQYSSFIQEIPFRPEVVDRFLQDVHFPPGFEAMASTVFLLSYAPDREQAKQILDEHKKEAPVLHMLPHRPVWGDGVMEAITETEEEKDSYFIAQNTAMTSRMLAPYLLMLQERDDVKFDIDSVTELILGSELIDHQRDETILAGIEAHFDGKYRLAVSLISLEFEPAIRYLMAKTGINYLVSDEKGAQRAMYLNEMLSMAKVQEMIGDSWTLLAETILLSEGGSKVRHRVAHGRDISDVASKDFSGLLIAMFLQVCNLRIIESELPCQQDSPTPQHTPGQRV